MHKFRITVCDPSTFTDGLFEAIAPSLAHCIVLAARRGWNIRGEGASQDVGGKWISLDAEMHSALGEAREMIGAAA